MPAVIKWAPGPPIMKRCSKCKLNKRWRRPEGPYCSDCMTEYQRNYGNKRRGTVRAGVAHSLQKEALKKEREIEIRKFIDSKVPNESNNATNDANESNVALNETNVELVPLGEEVTPVRFRHGKLSPSDLVELLEFEARTGSVQAIKLLLHRDWEKNDFPIPLQPEAGSDEADVVSQFDRLSAR